MGLLDSIKKVTATASDKAEDLAREHGDKIDKGIDKVAKVVDSKTGGKHRSKIEGAAGKAKGVVENLAKKDEGPGEPKSPPVSP